MVENTTDTIVFSDIDDSVEVTDADVFAIGNITLASKKFEKDKPPSFESLAGDDPELLIIAENLQKLTDAPGFVKFSQENRSDIAVGIRTFIYQACNNTKMQVAPISCVSCGEQKAENSAKTEKSNCSPDTVSKLTKELLKLENELKPLREKINQVERNNKDLMTEIDRINAENTAYYNQNAELIKKLSEARREYDSQGIEMKQMDMQFSEESNRLKDELELTKNTVQRLEKQLENTNEDFSQATAQVTILRSKLAAKNTKISDFKQQAQNQAVLLHQVEAENEQLNLQLNELMEKLEVMSSEIDALNPERFGQVEEERNNLIKGIRKLTQLCETQSNELTSLQDAYNRCGKVVQRQAQLITAYDARMGLLANEPPIPHPTDIEKAHTKVETPIQFSQQSSQISHISQISEEDQSKIDALDAVKSTLSDRYGELTDDGVVKAVSDLVDNQTQQELNVQKEEQSEDDLKAQNKRLLGLIENQLRFIHNLTTSGEIELYLLSTPNADDTLLEDAAYRDLILVEIARCRQFLVENNLEVDIHSSTGSGRSFLEAHKSGTLPAREGFDAAAFALQAADVLRNFSSQLVETNQRLMKGLEPCKELVPFDSEDICDLPEVLLAKLRRVRQFAKNCHDAMESEFDYYDIDASLKEVEGYVGESASLRRSIEVDLKPQLNSDVSVQEVPATAAQFIRDMMSEIENLEIQSANELRRQLTAVREELDEEKELSARAVGELETQLERREQELKESEERLAASVSETKAVKQQLSDAAAKRDDLSGKLDHANARIADVERDLKAARDENANMRREAKERQRQYDERATRLLGEERRQHEDDIEALELKFRAREEKMKDDLTQKSSKLAEAKKTLKKLIEDYDAAFRKQKEATAALRSQNQQLAARLSTAGPRRGSPRKQVAEVEQLRSEVRSLTAEKAMLTAKLQQSEGRAEQTAIARDQFWESQMAIRESEVSRTQLEIEENEREKLNAYVSDLADSLEAFAPRQFDGSADEVRALVKEVAGRLAEAERTAAAMTAARKNSSPSKSRAEEEKRAEQQLQRLTELSADIKEWERWARATFENAAGGEKAPEEPKELRRRIGDMAVSALPQQRLLGTLESLRAQKAALKAGANDASSDIALHAAPLFKAVHAIARLGRMKGAQASVIGAGSPTKSGLSLIK